MSGRKQFDETEVIDAAMMAFWRGGYEATSLTDLEAATGLNKSSLYNTFVSKEALFIRCLERYMLLYGEALLRELDHPDFRQAIEGFFNRLLNRFNDKNLPHGCLATFAAMEAGGIGAAVTKCVEGSVENRLRGLGVRCRRAVSEGQLPADTDCDSLATLLVAIAGGLAVLDQNGKGAMMTRLAVDGALSMIDTMMLRGRASFN